MRSSGSQGTWNMKIYWGGRREGREEEGEDVMRTGGKRNERRKTSEKRRRPSTGPQCTCFANANPLFALTQNQPIVV